jgi:hypothetical protein
LNRHRLVIIRIRRDREVYLMPEKAGDQAVEIEDWDEYDWR